MPTAARLFAAIAFAAVAYFASDSFKFLLPEGTSTGYLSEVNAVIGILCGWLVMGRLAGNGYSAAVGAGVRTSAVLLFYALLVHSIYQMLVLSTRNRYDGPMDALVGIFERASEYGLMAVTSMTVMGILLIGGVLAGWFSEWAAQRWN